MPLLEKDLNELPLGLIGLQRWAVSHDLCCILDGRSATDPDYSFPKLLAVGCTRQFELLPGHSLAALDDFLLPTDMGYVVQVGYGLKDHLEQISNRHTDPIGFPALFVYEPLVLIRFLENDRIRIQAADPQSVWDQLCRMQVPANDDIIPPVEFISRNTEEQYLELVGKVQAHIARGDCYELNYCQEYYAEGVEIDPLVIYQQLRSVVQAPFSCLYRNGNRWLMGASPERFLKRQGNRIESRPMKGTAPRDLDPIKDELLSEELLSSAKERSENIMVVDLVRNDLSRIAERGSVQVEALCALHSFPQVHQLVSTVTARVSSTVGLRRVLEACFPMGSMTGAPKIRVMELTDVYETSARGLYSGSIGFLEPNGDFDLNVVIRSLQYHAEKGYLSYHVGSGITAYSDPKKEWQECAWKSAGIRRVFTR
ncbi:MAG: hypothetical protein RL750_780 [Bacteroidota bacterium]